MYKEKHIITSKYYLIRAVTGSISFKYPSMIYLFLLTNENAHAYNIHIILCYFQIDVIAKEKT